MTFYLLMHWGAWHGGQLRRRMLAIGHHGRMPRKVPLHPALNASGFTVARARELGLGKHRLFGSDLARPFHGIRSKRLDETRVLGLCLAYRPRLRPDHFFSHATAALIHGMPVPLSVEADLRLHVTAIAPSSVPRTVGVVGHSVQRGRERVMSRNGYPVGSALQTWCELAGVLDRDDLVAVADYMVGGDRPLTSLGELAHAAKMWGRQRGGRRLREAAGRASIGAQSRMESLARMLVIDAGFPEPVVNGIVRDDAGRWVAESDLVFAEFKLVLEYDGDGHRTDRVRFLNDIDRRQRIEEAGWTVIQLTPRHIFERREHTIALIASHLSAHGWAGNVVSSPPVRARRR
ncbi:hypothetical protein ACX3O0_15900 [Homoserinimonas sp. A447]